jgi:hypothetical protein
MATVSQAPNWNAHHHDDNGLKRFLQLSIFHVRLLGQFLISYSASKSPLPPKMP